MDQILLTGLDCFGHHGCQPEEQKQGQHFYVDLMLGLDLAAAGKSDDLRQTVDYAAVFRTVRAVVEGEPCKLIESVAERIAASLLAEYPQVLQVEATVHKPYAPLPDRFQDAAVRIVRRRT